MYSFKTCMSLAYVETSWDLSLGRAIQLRGEKIYCGNKYILEASCTVPRLFHYTGISRKPWCAHSRNKGTFPGCCMKRYLLTFLCLGKGTEWLSQTVSLHRISRKLCFAPARYKVTFPGCCIAKIPFNLSLPEKGTEWLPHPVSWHRYIP